MQIAHLSIVSVCVDSHPLYIECSYLHIGMILCTPLQGWAFFGNFPINGINYFSLQTGSPFSTRYLSNWRRRCLSHCGSFAMARSVECVWLCMKITKSVCQYIQYLICTCTCTCVCICILSACICHSSHCYIAGNIVCNSSLHCPFSFRISSPSIYTGSGDTLKIITAMIGKFAIAGSFDFVYLYTAELYPTQVRNVGVGVASIGARLGGIFTPIVLLLVCMSVS